MASKEEALLVEKRTSVGSTGSRFWNLVIEQAQRDIQTEICYAEDKISLFLHHRQIELDPNFWCSDNDMVNLLYNGSSEEVQKEIERHEQWILGFKTQLSKSGRTTRFMYSHQADFHSAVDAFTRLMPIPDKNESADQINELTQRIKMQLLQLEETLNKNVELEMKLSSLDEQIRALQERMQEFNKSNYLVDVQPRLEAIKLQNCVLNELLSRIISDVQDTCSGMKIMECGHPHEVRNAVREGLVLSFEALDDCFPNLDVPRNALDKYLWVPHDSADDRYTLDKLQKLFDSGDDLDVSLVRRLKHLKLSVKDLERTHALVQVVKKKILWADYRKASNFGSILRYSIPKRLENVDRAGINAAIERDALAPIRSIVDVKQEEQNWE